MALTVRDVMVTDLVTVRPGATAREAYRLMRDRRFRHLPVLQDGRLVGILSDRDLRPVLLQTEQGLGPEGLGGTPPAVGPVRAVRVCLEVRRLSAAPGRGSRHGFLSVPADPSPGVAR